MVSYAVIAHFSTLGAVLGLVQPVPQGAEDLLNPTEVFKAKFSRESRLIRSYRSGKTNTSHTTRK